MILDRLFRADNPAKSAGKALYAEVVGRARNPVFYRDFAVPDTVEGRFELYTVHVVLLLDRLRRQGPRAAEIAQALFDAYVKGLDDALRDMGVGDLSVGKKMRKLGEAFYGRVKSYEKAFEALPDTAELESVIARTAYAKADPAAAPRLAAHILAQRAHLASADLESILEGKVAWADL
jgi:cytochrome b pre-mRNA-processing protein 3